VLDVTTLRKRLSQTTGEDHAEGILTAAVLVPFVEDAGGWSLIFTRRAQELSMHSGEISFPGGRVDPHESPRDAALREAQEELGIDAEKVEILGRLPGTFTLVSNYMIEPWVGILPSDDFTPNPGEIAEVIAVPLETLTAPGTQREQRFIRAGVMSTNPAYDVGPNTIWGATARILTNLLELLD
jgi:8-oxo-dGTP pyrophosphatase MutT (NUDIX family)